MSSLGGPDTDPICECGGWQVEHDEWISRKELANYCVNGHYEEGNPLLPECVNEYDHPLTEWRGADEWSDSLWLDEGGEA